MVPAQTSLQTGINPKEDTFGNLIWYNTGMSVSAKVKEKSSINFCNLYMVALLLLIPL